MKWLTGQPIDMGYYLCAVVDSNKPTELYWDGSSWGYYLSDWQPVDNNEVAYYMNLKDIPMPEGW